MKTPLEMVAKLREEMASLWVIFDHDFPACVRIKDALVALEAALANPPAGAVGELITHLNKNIRGTKSSIDTWYLQISGFVRAAEAEMAGERVILLKPIPGQIPDRLFGTPDGDVQWISPGTYAIRPLLAPPPKVKRPWRLMNGDFLCAACLNINAATEFCEYISCPQEGKPWGAPRDLPGGKEVEG